MRMLDYISSKFCPYEKYNVREYLASTGLTVARQYRGLGIGVKFLEARFVHRAMASLNLTELTLTILIQETRGNCIQYPNHSWPLLIRVFEQMCRTIWIPRRHSIHLGWIQRKHSKFCIQKCWKWRLFRQNLWSRCVIKLILELNDKVVTVICEFLNLKHSLPGLILCLELSKRRMASAIIP